MVKGLVVAVLVFVTGAAGLDLAHVVALPVSLTSSSTACAAMRFEPCAQLDTSRVDDFRSAATVGAWTGGNLGATAGY